MHQYEARNYIINMDKELQKYEKLKQKIMELDLAIPGYIRKIYQQCGQPSCKCKKSKKYYHGPYYLWGRRINDRLTSKSIPKKHVKLYTKWINNHKKLKKLVTEMLEVGCIYATTYKDKKNGLKMKT